MKRSHILRKAKLKCFFPTFSNKIGQNKNVVMVFVIVTKLFVYKHREKRRFKSSISAYSRLGFGNGVIHAADRVLFTTIWRAIPVFW